MKKCNDAKVKMKTSIFASFKEVSSGKKGSLSGSLSGSLMYFNRHAATPPSSFVASPRAIED